MEIRRNIEIGSLFQSSSTDFSLLDEPYITCVDAEQEFVVIYNPRNEYFALDHYSIADGKMYHTYKFPRRCKIPPRTEYCIYTCPGAPNFDHGSLMEYHVLWTNHDGSLRRMEVLNNEKCCVKLIDPKGAIISQCEAGMQNKQAAARRRLLEKQNSPFWQFWLRAQVAMLYLRVLALVGMTAACVAHSAVPFIILFWTALSFDLLSRGAVGKDAALCSVALLGDRISSIVLAGSLLFLLSQSDAASLPLEASETSGGSPSTPAIRLGAVAYYPSEESASENSTSSAPRTGVSGMAWVGMFVPGLSRKTLAAALMLELLATALNSRMLLCPREVHSYGSAVVAEIQEDEQEAQEASERIARGTQGAQDLYAYLGQLSPALLATVGAAAEYYQLHCFTSYHYKVDGGSDDLVTAATTSAVSAPWLYDLWVLAAALGCLAFNIKMANHASLVASAVAKMLKSK